MGEEENQFRNVRIGLPGEKMSPAPDFADQPPQDLPSHELSERFQRDPQEVIEIMSRNKCDDLQQAMIDMLKFMEPGDNIEDWVSPEILEMYNSLISQADPDVIMHDPEVYQNNPPKLQ